MSTGEWQAACGIARVVTVAMAKPQQQYFSLKEIALEVGFAVRTLRRYVSEVPPTIPAWAANRWGPKDKDKLIQAIRKRHERLQQSRSHASKAATALPGPLGGDLSKPTLKPTGKRSLPH